MGFPHYFLCYVDARAKTPPKAYALKVDVGVCRAEGSYEGQVLRHITEHLKQLGASKPSGSHEGNLQVGTWDPYNYGYISVKFQVQCQWGANGMLMGFPRDLDGDIKPNDVFGFGA